MSTILIKFIYYVLLKQNTRNQTHHPIIQTNLISSLRFQPISWNCYSYKPLSSRFLVAEGKVSAINLRAGADELRTFTKIVVKYSSQTGLLTKETCSAVSFYAALNNSKTCISSVYDFCSGLRHLVLQLMCKWLQASLQICSKNIQAPESKHMYPDTWE